MGLKSCKCRVCNRALKNTPAHGFQIGPECYDSFSTELLNLGTSPAEVIELRDSEEFDVSRWAATCANATIEGMKAKGPKRAEHLEFAKTAIGRARDLNLPCAA